MTGRVVMVTGAVRGLGREHARPFGRRGDRVVVNDIAPVPAPVYGA
jgi:NAD(P)-dependent dehydrogenase (short-subunit alcohol dehydrogenase family)